MNISDKAQGSLSGKIQFPIVGMSCMGCAAKVKSAISSVEGVKDAVVNLAEHSVTIQFGDQLVYPVQLQQAVHSVGYELIISGA
jgi:Cu2+-exporting ATPase